MSVLYFACLNIILSVCMDVNCFHAYLALPIKNIMKT